MSTEPAEARVPTGRAQRDRLRAVLRWTGIRSPLVASLVLAHLAFGLLRLPAGAVAKRAQLLGEYAEQGALWHFRLADEETRRTAAWLIEHVGPGQAVRFDGSEQGYLQLLAPALFPALMVRDGAVGAAREHAGRAIVDDRPPWLAAGEGRLVLLCERFRLRLAVR